MPRPFALPDLGEGLAEAEIVKVLVNEGDVLAEDAPLLEVETDKATVEIPSPFAGRVARIHVRPGQSVKVGDVLVTFEDSGGVAGGPARSGTPLAGEPSRHPAPFPRRLPVAAAETRRDVLASAVAPAARGGAPASTTAQSRAGDAAASASAASASGTGLAPVATGPVPATPATRRLARELGVDLRAVRGTGPGGRVTDDDVTAAAGGANGSRALAADGRGAERAAVQARGAEREAVAKPLAAVGVEPPALPRFEQWGPIERQPLSHLRRTIAERMTLSATLIPHVTHFDRA